MAEATEFMKNMTKRMLIDDTQPEETRVVVVNGNKLEDVEFESSSRKQIKGNVYLAKVMRIEPSLQAAFVDYGGNRHGFLAFGEIHPDYYNIDDKTMAEMEKEIDTMIENKKQAIKERELERARIREEKALKRAQRLEQEAAETAARVQAAAETKATEAEENKTLTENVVIDETATTAIAETPQPTEPAAPAEQNTENTSPAAEENPTAEKGAKRTGRGRRGRPAKNRRSQEEAPAEANDTPTAAGVEVTPAENMPQNAETVLEEVKSEVKTLAESAGMTEEKICEKGDECEYGRSEEHTSELQSPD